MPRVNVKGYGYVNFPADTPEEEMKSAIGKLLSGKAKIEEPAEPQATTVPEEKPGYMAGLGKYYTEDIPKTIQGAIGRTAERTQRIEAPTALGSAAQGALGTKKNFLGGLVEGVAGLPERATRTVAGAVGTIAEVPGMGIELFGRAANRLSGGALGKGLGKVGEAVAGSKTVQDVAKKYSELSPEAKANLGATVDLTSAFGMKGGEAVTKKPIEKSFKGLAKKIEGSLIKPKEGILKKQTLDELTDNVFKLRELSTGKKVNVAGTLKKTSAKIDNVFDDVENQITKSLKDAADKNPGLTVDASKLSARMEEKINAAMVPGAGEDVFGGAREEAQKHLEKWLGELAVQSPNYAKTGKVTLQEAQNFKRLLYKKLKAFKSGPPNIANAPEENVLDLLSVEFMKEVEKQVPGIRKLNNTYKELIPVKEAVKNAIPREGKKDIIGIVGSILGTAGMQAVTKGGVGVEDVLGGLVSGVTAAGAYGASRSGRTARALHAIGRGIKKAPSIPTGLKGLAGLKMAQNIKEEEEKKKKRKIDFSVY